MRRIDQLLHSRTRVRTRYALMPLEGYPPSRLPHWRDTEARILASPALGAAFVQYRLVINPGGGTHHAADGRTQTFFYLHDGLVELSLAAAPPRRLEAGGFAFVPAHVDYRLRAAAPSTILALRKTYEPVEGIHPPEPVLGNESQTPREPYMGNTAARLQTLLPDDPAFDMAMNIFTFDPGHSLPVVETHIMEHGLYFLAGKGMYFLDDEWMEVQTDDFIWMGPYCPQSFYATGPTPSRYIYYKNVNRDVTL